MAEPSGLTEVVVGRVGRAHGILGAVSVESRTDETDRRFSVGSVLRPTPSSRPVLTITSVRPHGDRLLVTFAEISDRTAAESLRGASLVVDVDAGARPDDPEEFYDRQLVGLRVRTFGVPTAEPSPAGPVVGTVVDLRHLPGQDLLEIRLDADDDHAAAAPTGDTVLVPFVRELVPTVDLDGGWLAVSPVPGLLDPETLDAGGSAETSDTVTGEG